MFVILFLGFGIGVFLAGILLLVASFIHQKRMRDPALIRWAGVMMGIIGFLLALIALLWK